MRAEKVVVFGLDPTEANVLRSPKCRDLLQMAISASMSTEGPPLRCPDAWTSKSVRRDLRRLFGSSSSQLLSGMGTPARLQVREVKCSSTEHVAVMTGEVDSTAGVVDMCEGGSSVTVVGLHQKPALAVINALRRRFGEDRVRFVGIDQTRAPGGHRGSHDVLLTIVGAAVANVRSCGVSVCRNGIASYGFLGQQRRSAFSASRIPALRRLVSEAVGTAIAVENRGVDQTPWELGQTSLRFAPSEIGRSRHCIREAEMHCGRCMGCAERYAALGANAGLPPEQIADVWQTLRSAQLDQVGDAQALIDVIPGGELLGFATDDRPELWGHLTCLADLLQRHARQVDALRPSLALGQGQPRHVETTRGCFRRQGASWEVSLNAGSCRLVPHRVGMVYLHRLVSSPGERVSALQLRALTDPGYGLMGSKNERVAAQKSVSSSLRRALTVIREQCPAVADHLRAEIQTGSEVVYRGQVQWETRSGAEAL